MTTIEPSVGSPLFILARQRSGANYLGGLLSSAFDAPILGEFLEGGSERRGPQSSFWAYLEHRCAEDPRAANPAMRRELLGEFLMQTDKRSDAGRYLADVKYNSAHHFEAMWASPGGRVAAFVAFCRAYRIPVVHLVRRNFLDQIVSLEKANRTGVFHSFKGGGTDPKVHQNTRISLPLEETVVRLRRMSEESKMVEAELHNYGASVTVEYEKITTSATDLEEVVRAIGEMITATPNLKSMAATTIKLGGVDFEDSIENFDELKTGLSREGFGPMLISGAVSDG